MPTNFEKSRKLRVLRVEERQEYIKIFITQEIFNNDDEKSAGRKQKGESMARKNVRYKGEKVRKKSVKKEKKLKRFFGRVKKRVKNEKG